MSCWTARRYEVAPDNIEKNFRQQPLLQAELLKTVGDAYYGVSEYQKAIPLLTRAAELAKTCFGADAPETLATLDNLALAQLHAGNYPKALEMLRIYRERRGGEVLARRPLEP